jgi:hypothetical protein
VFFSSLCFKSALPCHFYDFIVGVSPIRDFDVDAILLFRHSEKIHFELLHAASDKKLASGKPISHVQTGRVRSSMYQIRGTRIADDWRESVRHDLSDRSVCHVCVRTSHDAVNS